MLYWCAEQANWTIVHIQTNNFKPYEAYFICQILHFDQCSSGVISSWRAGLVVWPDYTLDERLSAKWMS